MKITIEGKKYKVLKIIKAQDGDMIIRDTEGFDEKEKSYRVEPEPFYAYHSDQFGIIEYSAPSTFLNYSQYKSTMVLIGKEPKPFIEYMMSVLSDSNWDTGLWENELPKAE